MAKDDASAKPKRPASVVTGGTRVTIAFPFSAIRTEEPSDDVRELATLVADLADAIAQAEPSAEREELRRRAHALSARLAK